MSEDDFKILYSIQKDNDTSTWEIEDWKKAFDAAKESAEELNGIDLSTFTTNATLRLQT